MNNKEKQSVLLLYLIVFILCTILSTSDLQMLISQVLVSMLFGVTGTLLDKDLKKKRMVERISRIIKQNKN